MAGLLNNSVELWLTTDDNPYNPFDNYDEWDAVDRALGYNTASYIARIAKTSSELSDDAYNAEINRAVLEIYQIEPLKIYNLVKKIKEN